jgi:membrane protein EpsK
MKNQILNNLGSNYILSFFGMALGFLLVPFLIRNLGKEAYGITVLVESTVAFFEILTVSVRMALSRHATFALSSERLGEFREYLSTGQVILYASSVAVIMLGFVISLYFTNLFRIPAVYATDSRVLFLLVSMAFTISVPNIVFWSVLYAKQRFDLINLSMSLGLIVRAVLIFIYYLSVPPSWKTLTAYGVIYLVMTYIQNYMTCRWSKILMPGLTIDIRFFKRERVREILSFSLHSSLTRISSLLYQETSQIITNILWGPAYNAIYSVALKLPNTMRKIFLEPSWALTPTFTDLAARGDKQRMETLLFLYSKVLSIATVPLSFVLIFFSEPIILAWVGPDFEMAGKLMPLFSISLFVGIPFSLSGCLMNAFGKVKIPSLVSLATALVNLVLCVVLGHWLSWKLYGIAWATVISSLLTATFFYPIYACRAAGISIRRYSMESLVKPLALACLLIGIGFWMLQFTPFGGRLNWAMALTIVFLSAVYYLTAYALLFNLSEKITLWNLFPGKSKI